MYQLSLEDRRHFRKMEYGILYNIRHRCSHRYFQKIKSQDLYLTDERPEIFVCNKCKIGWHIHHRRPPTRGNPILDQFIKNCEHINVKTLYGSESTNQCLECDALIEKTEIAKVWKGIRNVTSRASNIIKKQFKEETTEEKINSGRDIKFVWDPELYGDKKWDVEYND
jgi:hypothetical protein